MFITCLIPTENDIVTESVSRKFSPSSISAVPTENIETLICMNKKFYFSGPYFKTEPDMLKVSHLNELKKDLNDTHRLLFATSINLTGKVSIYFSFL